MTNEYMDRRNFLKSCARAGFLGLFTVGAGSFLISNTGCQRILATPSKPNQSLVDKLQYVPEKKAMDIIRAYHENPDTFEQAVSSLFSMLGQDENGFSEIAYQLGQIPEFLDDITESEVKALDGLVNLYLDKPEEFEKAFKKMDETGIKDIRKYNSPMQALFWLAEDRRLKKEDLVNYNNRSLIYRAWSQQGTWKEQDAWKTLFSEDDKKEILEGIKILTKKTMYSMYFEDFDLSAVRQLAYDIKNNPDFFNKKARKIIKNAIEEPKFKKRWDDYYVVSDRLNDPILVDVYINKFISYELTEFNIIFPKSVFKYKKADCADITYFADQILTRAGYETSPRVVPISPIDHVGLAVIKDNQYFLVVNFKGRNRTSGPFDSMRKLEYSLSDGQTAGRKFEYHF